MCKHQNKLVQSLRGFSFYYLCQCSCDIEISEVDGGTLIKKVAVIKLTLYKISSIFSPKYISNFEDLASTIYANDFKKN